MPTVVAGGDPVPKPTAVAGGDLATAPTVANQTAERARSVLWKAIKGMKMRAGTLWHMVQ